MATTTISPCPPTAADRRREEEVVGRRILVFWARGARGAGRVAPGGMYIDNTKQTLEHKDQGKSDTLGGPNGLHPASC